MTMEATAGSELVAMEDDRFSSLVKDMEVKELMDIISVLQREMSKEQENFNSLSAEIQTFKDRNSRQYKQISKDLVISQQRLTLLMNRSMTCFSQQNHNAANNVSPFKRRNSVKGPNSLTTPTAPHVNLQRSQSLLVLNQSPEPTPPQSITSPTSSSEARHSQTVGGEVVSHVPVIMKPTANGVVIKPATGVTTPTVVKTTGVVKYGVSTKPTTSSGATTTTLVAGSRHSDSGSHASSSDSAWRPPPGHGSSSDGSSTVVDVGAGVSSLYVKRKPAQTSSRVTTTTNFTTSKILPVSQQTPVSSTSASGQSSSNSSVAATPSSSSRLVAASQHSPAISDSTNRTSAKSHPVVPPPEYVSPLQAAQARKGLSRSQTHILDSSPDPNPYPGGRMLPSVKLLAKTFGSNTTLNVLPDSTSTSRGSASSSSGIYRSNSSLNLSAPAAAAPTRIYISTNSAGSSGVAHPYPVVMTSSTLPNNQSRQRTTPVTLNRNNESDRTAPVNELEKTRSGLRSVSVREVGAGTANGNPTPVAANARLTNKDEDPKHDRVDDTNARAGTYVKKKDAAPVKVPPATFSAMSAVTVKSINSSSSLSASGMAGTVRSVAPHDGGAGSSKTLPAPASSRRADVRGASISRQTSSGGGDYTATSKNLTFSSTQSKQPAQSSALSSSTLPRSGVSSRATTSTAAISAQPERVLPSTSAGTLRRAKSREELQQVENDTRQHKDLMLQQIQAARRDQESHKMVAGQAGSRSTNMAAMSSLSRSLPSLLLEEGNDGVRSESSGSKNSPIKSSVQLSPPELEKLASDPGAFVDDGIEMEDEEKIQRMNLRNWDPKPVLGELYQVKLMDEIVEDISHQYISMEGLMEKLPMNKRKATLLKTWKRRFFKASDGWLYYYEPGNRDQPSESIQLMGGIIEDIGGRILGIDDGRGRYLMVRCPTEKEFSQWKVSLESQTADNTKATYIQPVLKSPLHASKNVVIIDLGSSAIRAGSLGQQASLPELFFPSLVAVDKDTGRAVAVGAEALRPDIRHKCRIVQPIRPSNKVDQFNIEVQLLKAIFDKVFLELKVNAPDCWVMLSTPQNLGDPLKKGLMEILVDILKVKGVCMVPQALLSLYSYNATSGIIVDIGYRMEILPIFDGFVIEGGVARCPYGAQKVQETLNTSLLTSNYKFCSTTEQLLVRYIMEKACYVAMDYEQEVEWCKSQPEIRKIVSLNKFDLPDGSYTNVECDLGRFKSPEGFFNVNLWEMDYPTLQRLVYQAIQTCPMDNRRHVWRAVFLSGGVTLLPGFAERLEEELRHLAPPGVPVEVHAAPQRYHAAFVGACSVALMPQFEGMAISREEWKKNGVKAFRKWQTSAS